MNDNDDPVVGFRAPFNRLSLNYRQSALNAEGMRVMRMISDASDIESSQADDIKMTVILMYEEMSCIEDDNSSSSWMMHNNDDSDSFELSDLPDDSSIVSLHMSSCQPIDLCTEDASVVHDYEDIITSMSLMYDVSIDHVHELHEQMFEYSVLRQSDLDLMSEPTVPKQNRMISDLTQTEAMNWTRFKKEQLNQLKTLIFGQQACDFVRYKERRLYHEEILIIALTYQANGEKYSSMKSKFGGNWCGYSYLINYFVEHMHDKYFNIISGNSMRYWRDHILNFRESIWKCVAFDDDGERIVNIELDNFRVYGFIDCIGHRTCTPGAGPILNTGQRRDNSYETQRAFYTRYGKKHGLKTQVVMLPNGMVGHAAIHSIAQNDRGMVNLTGIEEYLRDIFQDQRLGNALLYPALFGDKIYQASEVIIMNDDNQDNVFMRRMNSTREKIEHLFGLFNVLNKLLMQIHTLQMLKK